MSSQGEGDRSSTPIAIVGMSCRLPGAASTDELWSLLKSRVDAVGEVPKDRWDTEYYYSPDSTRAGKMYTRAGGFIDNVDKFDAAFFGIAPREAEQMDPQQRLLLEMVWEAMESAGMPPTEWAGSNTGVFIGASTDDYWTLQRDQGDAADPYMMSGSALSIIANRISFIFDFHGPSLSTDTACSSALVALHEACVSLRSGESVAAVAGGVNLVLSPWGGIGFSRARMLSPTGRCRAFDAKADGYVRSEGGGVVILKPLDRAVADGNPIHALILATGVNSDGHTSGISLPNASAQEQLLRQVYARADVDPAKVVYVEAHGTGTSAGDPLECAALGRVFGSAREKGRPLRIGSIKTNIGHTEAAAGIAGLLKAVLCLEHREVPASLHFETPNPNIPFADLNLMVAAEAAPMPHNPEPLVVGVNSFGFGGTNAHAVLCEPPGSASEPKSTRAMQPLFISARSASALRALAGRYAALLRMPDALGLAAICRTALTRRSQHDHRLAISGHSHAEIADSLEAFADSDHGTEANPSNARVRPTRICLVFSGNGSQWFGMGRELWQSEPVFADWVNRTDSLLRPLLGWSVADAMRGDAPADSFDKTEIAQPALFALQIGIVEWLRASGVNAEASLGHSVGEVAAAYAAGILSLEQACLVIARRSQAQGRTAGKGKMAAVGLALEQAETVIAPYGASLTIASVNSPTSVTLAGEETALRRLGESLAARGVFHRLLPLNYAFHSSAMDPIKGELLDRLDGLAPARASSRFISTVTGDELAGTALGAGYWWENIRHPVQFAAAVGKLIDEGIDFFLEIGPHPILSTYVRDCLTSRKKSGSTVASQRRREPQQKALWNALGECYARGCAVDVAALFPDPGPCVDLPAYPWQRERFWMTTRAEPMLPRLGRPEHPLLGYRLPTAQPTWQNSLDLWRLPYLRDHVLHGNPVFPATGYVEMALSAAALRANATAVEIEELEIHRPFVLSDDRSSLIEFSLASEDSSFRIALREPATGESSLFASGRLTSSAGSAAPASVSIESIRARMTGMIDGATHYRRCAEYGLSYGLPFQGIENLWIGSGEALGKIAATLSVVDAGSGYQIHPALLDACLQASFGAIPYDGERAAADGTFVPTVVKQLRLSRGGVGPTWCHAELRRRSRGSVVVRLTLLDGEGNVVGEIGELQLRRLDAPNAGAVPAYHWRTLLRNNPFRHPEPAVLPDITALVAGVLDGCLGARREVAADRAAAQALGHLAAAYAWTALEPVVGDKMFTVAGLVDAGVVNAKNTSYLRSLLGLLRRRGLATQTEAGWALNGDRRPDDPTTLWRRMVAEYPECLGSLQLIARYGDRLPMLMRGDMEVSEVVSPKHDRSAIAQLYSSDPLSRLANATVRSVIRQVAQLSPADRPLSFLEIGGGTGGLTRAVLPVLPRERCEYVFADADAESVQAAELALADVSFLRCALLDINRDPLVQGFSQAQFDVVLIANTLSEAPDLRTALFHLRSVLKPGGLLVLIEAYDSDFLGFIFGMAPGWQAFTDIDLRADSPLLPPDRWENLLEQVGFGETATVLEEDGLANRVILARNLDDAIPTALRAADEPALWLAFVDAETSGEKARASTASATTERLGGAGHRVITVTIGESFQRLGPDSLVLPPADPESYRLLFRTLRQEVDTPRINVLFARGLSSALPPDGADPMAAQKRGALDLVVLCQAADAAEIFPKLRLWVITSGAIAGPSGGAVSRPEQAPLWGVGRTLMNERPGFACRLIDVDPDAPGPKMAECLLPELLHPDDEDEIVLRGGARYVLRLSHGMPPPPAVEPDSLPGTPFAVEFSRADGQETNRLYAIPLPHPSSDQVLVRVHSVGLNFRDVLQRSGILPQEAFEGGFAGATLGMEFAGEIVAAGPGVDNVAPGDQVFGFAPAAMRSHLVTHKSLILKKPEDWSFEGAATVPVAFTTVLYSLRHLARLRRGERILIHGGAGGVGLAAIQYAQWVGAEIFASAGSEEKRQFLRRLGVQHVVDSRTLGFADAIRHLTDGEGVDVVLNSLAGEALLKGVSVLRPFGRFIELGKRDFYANSKLGLAPFRENVQFSGVDLDRLLAHRPEVAGELLEELASLIHQDILRPLPHRTFAVTEAAGAMRHLQQSQHIGKVVLSLDEAGKIERSPADRPLELRSDATYVVTGGRGGFGLATAEWLAAKGARHLVLVGRSADTKPAVGAALDRIRTGGVEVREVALDVADGLAVEGLLRVIDLEMPPLRGVVHCAAVFDDASFSQLTPERFAAVLRPKLLGAWNLHRLTGARPLDFFVLYSSAVTLIGNPGQTNYVAANCYLEALAHYRRGRGLHALVMGWGAIAEVGHVADDPELARAMTDRLGITPIVPRQAFAALEKALVSDATEAVAADVSWPKLAMLPALNGSPKYGELRGEFGDSGGKDGELDPRAMIERLGAMSREEAVIVVSEVIAKQVAAVMRMPVGKLDASRSLIDLGMDSLMVVELHMGIEQRLGISIPTLDLMDLLTVTTLAQRIVDAARTSGTSAANGDARHPAGNGADSAPEVPARLSLGEVSDAPLGPQRQGRVAERPR